MSGWWSGHKIMDPGDLEARYSVEDGMAFMDAIVSEEITEEGSQKLDRVRAVMGQIPPREADFLDLYYFHRIKQTDIAAMFGVSQPTVCYRLQRAAARIQFLMLLPEINLTEIEKAMAEVLADPIDARIMVLMLETTCQSEVAKRLDVSQGFVRHRFIRSIAKLRKHEDVDMGRYVTLFDLVSANLNILREVQRPSWDSKVVRVLL